jgi:hypothetical protein
LNFIIFKTRKNITAPQGLVRLPTMLEKLKASKSHYADHQLITSDELKKATLAFGPTLPSNGFRSSKQIS